MLEVKSQRPRAGASFEGVAQRRAKNPPLLTPEQEIELALEIQAKKAILESLKSSLSAVMANTNFQRKMERAEADLRAALTPMVEANLGLPVFVAKQVARKSSNGTSDPAFFDELVQEGLTTLRNAALKFDPSKARFSTYAVRSIFHACNQLLKRQSIHHSRYTALNGNADFIQDSSTSSLVEQREQIAVRRNFLKTCLHVLNEQERKVIEMRFGLNAEGSPAASRTREAVGRDLGMSKERVRHIERTALEKIKKWIEKMDERHGLEENGIFLHIE